jgi:hypothetical protein
LCASLNPRGRFVRNSKHVLKMFPSVFVSWHIFYKRWTKMSVFIDTNKKVKVKIMWKFFVYYIFYF